MRTLSTNIKIILPLILVATLVATRWNSLKTPSSVVASFEEQLDSRRTLRGATRKLMEDKQPKQLQQEEQPTIIPGLENGKTGGTGGGIASTAAGGKGGTVSDSGETNAGGSASSASFGSGSGSSGKDVKISGQDLVFTFSPRTAGGSGGGASSTVAGGSISPVLIAGVGQFQISEFRGNTSNAASGFGGGFVGFGPLNPAPLANSILSFSP
jgi:hypothetical protein